ncbi:hypothetical protein [Brevundimonas vesicularis]|uniref:hypothetical protein n=1 Tax=Brevundimonas vesicularis TaxID=41276 RepID=UPI00384DC063
MARAPDGGLQTRELLPVNPKHYADAAVEGIRPRPARPVAARSGRGRADGPTVATTALQERKASQRTWPSPPASATPFRSDGRRAPNFLCARSS